MLGNQQTPLVSADALEKQQKTVRALIGRGAHFFHDSEALKILDDYRIREATEINRSFKKDGQTEHAKAKLILKLSRYMASMPFPGDLSLWHATAYMQTTPGVAWWNTNTAFNGLVSFPGFLSATYYKGRVKAKAAKTTSGGPLLRFDFKRNFTSSEGGGVFVMKSSEGAPMAEFELVIEAHTVFRRMGEVWMLRSLAGRPAFVGVRYATTEAERPIIVTPPCVEFDEAKVGGDGRRRWPAISAHVLEPAR